MLLRTREQLILYLSLVLNLAIQTFTNTIILSRSYVNDNI